MGKLIATWSVAALLAGGVLISGLSAHADEDSKVLRHIVLYKFKDDLAPADVQEVVDTFAALPSKIDTIVDFEHGTNVSPEGKSEGLTHAFVVTFRDEASRDVYLKHPAHLEYVEVVRDRREKVVVFDYWVDE
ncbi:MAG: Dabb family protein [Planctomycetota bacterium]|nr:MAG: Dabb family protein [Planctomycetota bacterium]